MKEHFEQIVKSRQAILDAQERKLQRYLKLKQQQAVSDEEVDNQTILRELAVIDLNTAKIGLEQYQQGEK